MAHLDLDFTFDQASTDKAFEGLERECERIISGLGLWIFDGILNRTPQYYGRMVASWTYSVNSEVFVDRSDLVPAADWQEGDPLPTPRSRGWVDAIEIAKAENITAGHDFKLGDTIFISNGVDHGEGPYALDIEQGKVPLRSVNRPGHPVQRTLDTASARFSNDMTPSAASAFKHLAGGF